MSNLFDVEGRIAVVTGASSGIGLAVSKILSACGAKVVMIARREQTLETEVRTITEQGGHAKSVAADLLDRKQLESCFLPVCDCFGHPDIVVNAAGVNLRQPAEQIDWEGWDDTINLNLSAPFFFSRFFVDNMKAQKWGKIINIASLQSVRAFSNGIAYGASKGGVTQLTRAMAESWSQYGISCNAIAPGFFHTALTASVFENQELAEQMADKTAIGRNGSMEDLHGPVLFLASNASNYVTGQLIFVDGGFTAK